MKRIIALVLLVFAVSCSGYKTVDGQPKANEKTFLEDLTFPEKGTFDPHNKQHWLSVLYGVTAFIVIVVLPIELINYSFDHLL